MQVRAEEEPNLGVRFTDAEGNEHSYSIARNADDTEIVLNEFR